MAQVESSKKEFKFRGKTLEELKKLDTREFAQLINSRNRRTILRNFQEIEDFLNRAKEKIRKGKTIRTHKRDLIIIPEMVEQKEMAYIRSQMSRAPDMLQELTDLVGNIDEDKGVSYKPHSIRLFDFFGAADETENGYIFVPDGIGALINLNSGRLE
ncbi:MAG: DUF5696 domain-containing protein, partial [Minisyncoccales bacterium]